MRGCTRYARCCCCCCRCCRLRPEHRAGGYSAAGGRRRALAKGTSRGPRDRWGWHGGKEAVTGRRPIAHLPLPPPAFRAPFNTATLSHLTSEVPHPSVPSAPFQIPPAAYPVRRTLRRLPTNTSTHSLPHATPISTPLPIPPPITWRMRGPDSGSGAGDGGRGRPVPWMSHPLGRVWVPGSQPGKMQPRRMEPRGRALEAGGRENEPPHPAPAPRCAARGRREAREAAEKLAPPACGGGSPEHSASGGWLPRTGTLPDALRSGQQPPGSLRLLPGPLAPSLILHPPAELLRIRSCPPH